VPLIDSGFRYTWLLWAAAFLVLWAIVFYARSSLRRRMLWAGFLTAPFGLTEPLFVPAYWNPPSLFNLAQRTGFDIESLIFCFAIGGLGVVGYSALAPVPLRRMDHHARSLPQHRWHLLALASPFFAFVALYFLDWNPIYPGIFALAVGAVAALLCRLDLWRNTLYGGGVFLALYAVFLLGLKWLWPGYIEAVWNVKALMDWRPAGLPAEELLFGAAFGMYWSSVVEHLSWRQRDVAMVRAVTGSGRLVQ
jgi:hypothetical protein